MRKRSSVPRDYSEMYEARLLCFILNYLIAKLQQSVGDNVLRFEANYLEHILLLTTQLNLTSVWGLAIGAEIT